VRESLASAKAGTRFARAGTVHAIHTQTGVPLSLLTIMISWCNTPVESYKGTTVVPTQLREGIGHIQRAALAEKPSTAPRHQVGGLGDQVAN
jgi:hypothetical protein